METKSRDMLIRDEITESFGWMADSVPIKDRETYPVHDRETYTLDELIENSDDIYEVHVILHMCNGEVVHARNHCIEHLGSYCYNGDECEYYDGMFKITIRDNEGNFRQHAIHPSNIVWVEAYSEDVDWKLVKQQQEKQQ